MPSFDILQFVDGEWKSSNWPDCPTIEELYPYSYVFLNDGIPEEDKERRKKLLSLTRNAAEKLRYSNVPRLVYSDEVLKSNGYVGCEASITKDDTLEACSYWFRCLVKRASYKQVSDSDAPVNKTSSDSVEYRWYELTFFVQWEPRRCIFLGIDTPKDLQSDIEATLKLSPLKFDDAFAMYTPLMDGIIKLYDQSVWDIRNLVRPIEKAREEQTKIGAEVTAEFSLLHEILRHSLHVSEVLTVTSQTTEELRQHRQAILEATSGKPQLSWEKTNSYLKFQTQMLQSYKHRQQSNNERLQSEITLAYNIIMQRDSNRLKDDSEAMKTVAILTLFYLPATFTSAIFGMNFFDFSAGDDDEGDEFRTSKQIWMFWLTAAALTVATFSIWFFWRKKGQGNTTGGRPKKLRNNADIENQKLKQ